MALLASPDRAVRFTFQCQRNVAVLAQPMKHGLHFSRDIPICLVAVVAEALSGAVDEIVVTGDAVVGGVVGVREGHGQQGCGRSLFLVLCGAIDRDEGQKAQRRPPNQYAPQALACGVNRHDYPAASHTLSVGKKSAAR